MERIWEQWETLLIAQALGLDKPGLGEVSKDLFCYYVE